MKVAIVGTGVSGLVTAHLLHHEHELTLFEAGSYVGGHTVTTQIERGGRSYAVDAGFVVFNEPNYPNLVRLFERLGVATEATQMSFSVRCERSGIEYCGTSLDTLFAQRRNAVRWAFLRMLLDIARFNRRARRALASGLGDVTLDEFLRRGRYSGDFVDRYLLPMTAAIWSTDPVSMREVPARFLLSFLDNHGLLRVTGQPDWRVVRGGSARYVDAITRPFRDRIRLATPVRRLRRTSAGVEVATDSGSETFDEVVVATHSDQALRLLERPTAAEREVLGAIPYQKNDALLHTDSSVLPRNRRAWASWNYHVPEDPGRRVSVTYNMNMLQGLESDSPFCVSLNMNDRVRPESVIRRFSFSHPLFTREAVAAQKRHGEISGRDRIHYCGAYWRNGFHEDGVVSALEVARSFDRALAEVAA